RVVLKDGKLYAAPSRDEQYEMTALSENRFQLLIAPVVLTFEDAGAGTPQQMNIQSAGQESPDVFERVVEWHPTPNQLGQYAGRFVSDEIEPIYRIELDNGSLVLKRLKSKPEKLDPTLEDHFQGPVGDMHFERDAAGKVTGFVLNSGRVKNFHFRKSERG